MSKHSPARALVIAASLLAVSCGTDNTATDIDSEPGVTSATPDSTDLSIAAVPLEDIIFDTFDGNSVPLSEASSDQIDGLRDAIIPIRSPRYVSTGEIVNDTIAGRPVLITYCPLCRSGVVYDRRPDDLRHDGTLTFGNTSALYNNDLVMIDDETNTFWWQVAGTGLVGSLTNARLTLLPSQTLTWAAWRDAHPQGSVLSNDLGLGRSYQRDPFDDYADRVNEGQLPFPVDEQALNDDRLPLGERVVAFTVADQTFAVAVDQPSQTVVIEHGGQSVAVELDGAGGASVIETTTETAWPSRDLFWFSFLSAHPEDILRQRLRR